MYFIYVCLEPDRDTHAWSLNWERNADRVEQQIWQLESPEERIQRFQNYRNVPTDHDEGYFSS